MKRTERDHAANSERHRAQAHLTAGRRLLRRLRYDEGAVFVVEIDHVGIAVARQRQHVAVFVLRGDLADQQRAIAAASIVEIDEQPAVDVDQQHAVLDHGRDAEHLDTRRQFEPLPVRQDRDLEALDAQIVCDPATDVIGKQNVPAPILARGCRR